MTQTTHLDLLGSNETTAPWLEHLERIGPPPVAPGIPEGDAFLAVLADLAIPEGEWATLVALRQEVVNDPGLRWLLERSVHSLSLHLDTIETPPAFPNLPAALGEISRYFFAFVYIAMLPHTHALYRQRGVPDEVFRATMADVGRHFLIHRAQHGNGGMSGQDWLMLHARGSIFQLGRLQFERARLGNRTSKGIQAAGYASQKGDPVLAVHIPGFCGPFPPDACDASFAQARAFFATHFPEERYEIAVCHSWLLDEQLADYLPESSNIVQFQRRFRQAYRPDPNNRTTLEFVFRTPDAPLDDLPQTTTLECAVVRHIREGRHWHGGMGWLEL
jgi:hypothetical protein